MKHTRLWWVTLACFLAYYGTVKFLTRGVIAGQTGVGGNPVANLANLVAVYYFFLGPALTFILFGVSFIADVIAWRERRRQWKASSDS